MRQQINLHQQDAGRGRTPLNGRVLLAAVSGLGLLLGAASALLLFQLRQEAQRLSLLERERTAAQQELEALSLKGAAAAPSGLLEQELGKLRREREQKLAALQLLAGGSIGNVEGFAGHFEALARQRLPGLWLTRINLARGGQQIELAGAAVDEALLPRYLGKLAQEQVFVGLEFRSAAITRSSAQATEVSFELGTESGGRRP